LVTFNGPGPSGRLDEVRAPVGHDGTVPQGCYALLGSACDAQKRLVPNCKTGWIVP